MSDATSNNKKNSENIHTIPVLSEEFFAVLDDNLAKSVDLREVTRELNNATKSLSELKRNRHTMEEFGKEQRERIELVSTHWFYGTTAFQPQLWFRGGCQGKIDRAQTKLDKVNLAMPQINDQISIAEQHLESVQYRHNIATVASNNYQAMRERAIKENPTPELVELQRLEKSLQSTLDSTSNEAASIRRKISRLDSTIDDYKAKNKSLLDAMKHNTKLQCLKEALDELETNEDRVRNVRTANTYQRRNGGGGVRDESTSTSKEEMIENHKDRIQNVQREMEQCYSAGGGCGFLSSADSAFSDQNEQQIQDAIERVTNDLMDAQGEMGSAKAELRRILDRKAQMASNLSNIQNDVNQEERNILKGLRLQVIPGCKVDPDHHRSGDDSSATKQQTDAIPVATAVPL